MLRSFALASVVVASLFAGGCVTNTQSAANSLDLDKVDFTKISKYRRGESCINNVLFIFSWGENLVTAAAKDGKIKKVRFIEQEIRSYFIFNKFCMVVYGE